MRPGTHSTIRLFNLWEREWQRVRCWTTIAPGLVAHESIGDPGWVLTHDRSGMHIPFMFDDPEQVQAFAASIAHLADWTQSGETIHQTKGIGTAIRQAAEQHNGELSTSEDEPTIRAESLAR